MFRSQALTTGLLALFLAGATSATTVTLDEGFETFTVGSVGGQNGWGIFSPSFPETITTAQAHGAGTKSLYTGMPDPYNQPLGSGATKALDAATQGEFPGSSVTFPTGYASDWWVRAWVRVESGGTGARMMISTWGWYLSISGTGTPTAESAIPATPPATLPNQGANVLDQWVFVQMAHNSATDGCAQGVPGRCIDFSILGDNVNLSYSRYYTASGPLSQYLVLSGDAYWDDVSAGTGLAPAVVPLPAAGWLLASALGTLAGRQRRKGARRA
jgi:hypothetical protein